MIRILGTIFAGLLGLAFGSFLNVCLSRWPAGESVVRPRSHCRNCDHTLAWWENVPLVSWLALRGRCRKCGTRISWRYPLVEFAVGALWGIETWQWSGPSFEHLIQSAFPWAGLSLLTLKLAFYWILIALAVLDVENLWLPNRLTLPGIALGFINAIVEFVSARRIFIMNHGWVYAAAFLFGGVIAAAALILIIRWLYKLIRKREGMGLGDAKLMALLAAWLGLPGALLALDLGAVLGSVVALALLAVPDARRGTDSWAATKLPFGTFLCIGGIVSALWGQPIMNTYLRWAGF
jgi:leader peptidase (prepilin peptidase)/N-methyltransferase